MRIIIVGSVAAGTSAGAKIRRRDKTADVVIYERGSAISYSGCGLPYYVGGEVAEMSKLVPRGPAWFADRYQIDVRIRHEVTEVDPQARTVEVTDLDRNTSFTDIYDVLILATGASPRPARHARDPRCRRLPGLHDPRTPSRSGRIWKPGSQTRSSSAAASSGWRWSSSWSAVECARPWSNGNSR